MSSYASLQADPEDNPLKNPLKKANLEWLRKKQDVAIPILPPTTELARKRFFKWIPEFLSGQEGLGDIYRQMAFKWNSEADGEEYFYVTADILKNYAKRWQTRQNATASEALAKDAMPNADLAIAQLRSATSQFPTGFIIAPDQNFAPTGGQVTATPEATSSTSASVSTCIPLAFALSAAAVAQAKASTSTSSV